MKKITLTLFALVVTCCMWQVDAQTFTALDTPQTVGPNAGTVTASIATSTAVGVVGLGNGEFSLDNVSLNIDHTWADDLDMTLTSPGGGVTVDLSTDNGGRFGLTPAADLVFTDSSVNDVTTWGSFAPEADYQAEGGLLNTLFAGEPANGDWTLTVTDDTNGDSGNLNSYSITFSENLGAPPVIACPADSMINTTGGLCTGVTNWVDPIVVDPEDGLLVAMHVSGPMSGDALAPGAYVVTYSATDSDGNTAMCSFNVTVADMEAPIVVCQDISLDLDAAGSVSVTPADLDNGSSDNCGIVTSTMTTGVAATNTVEVSFAGGNGQAGNMFDVVALNPITVNSFDISMDAGVTADVEVYSKTGTWVGSDMDAAAWTLVAAVPGVVSGGQNLPTPLNLSLGIDVAAGDTVAFYVTLVGSTAINYTNGGTVGDVWASDANLQVLEGAGKVYPFGSTFQPRNFNGNIVYDTGEVPFSGTFDCSHIGANVINVTHTDAAGNSSTCQATVTIADVTAPVISCIGQPANITDSTTDNTVVPIPDTSDVTSIMTVTDDFVITDLNVDLDISHTWVGDLIVTITAPTGESAVIIDRMGEPLIGAAGCGSDDLLVTLDDEAALPIEDVCDAGPPAASGSYSPNNPLSIFDGVSTVGDWIINISDNAAGDTGTLNSWGLSYGHDVSGSPLEVVLDANGLATVNASGLLMNVDEACGWNAIFAGTPPTTNSLTTTFAGGNGQAGNMMDIMAINDLTIDSFDISFDAGVTDDVEVYFKTGTWVGFDADPSAWTLLTTVAGVTSLGDNVPTPLNQTLGVNVAAGETVAFYVTMTTTTSINYTNGTTTGALFASDTNMEVYEGAGNVYPFAGTFMPRNFNGNIVYSTGSGPSASLDLDCSMLGENLLEVTVVDDSGNTSTCTATVIVKDETAPVLVCTDATIELGPDGTAIVDPLALLGTSPGTFTVLVIGSDNQSNAEGFTDLTVPVTDAVSVSFDWDYVLNDVPGFDGFGYLLNGAYTQLTDPAIGDQSGNETVALVPGDVFGFRSQTDDNVFGNNETVISNFMPGFTGQFAPANWTETLTNSDGSASFIEIPGGPLSFDACGITDYGVSITEVNCDDIGTPVTITVFASDSSGNSATCTSTVTVVDALAPVITCPADQTVDPGPGNLFYTVPDYFGTGEATADDNCTDPVTITTQDPAPGALISDGTHTVTLTGEDAFGNVGTCTFVLTVESVLGVESNELNNAISMYPNPAQEHVTISNSSNIQLETAVIYDLNGKMINQIDLSTMQGEQMINISELASGVYVVQLTSDTSSAIKRLVKE